MLGLRLGEDEGLFDGDTVGKDVGPFDGLAVVGSLVGVDVTGATEGCFVGFAVVGGC